jgi:hypothetical protein
MMLLGLVILMATSAFTVLLVTENWSGTPEYTVNMFGNDIATLNSVAIFLSGIALIFMLALGMIRGGMAFRNRGHKRYAEVGPTEWRARGRRDTARRGSTAPPHQREQAPGSPPPGDEPPPTAGPGAPRM